MDRQDAAGLLAALGVFLLAVGVGGSASLDTPVFGELIGLSEGLSFRLAGVGVALLISVSVVGSLVERVRF